MKPLEQALKDYLRIRRSLGFQLREVGGLLRNFVVFLQAEGASHITREQAVRWATQARQGSTPYLDLAFRDRPALHHLV